MKQQIEIYSNEQTGCAAILAAYINFYTKHIYSFKFSADEETDIHPLCIQVMKEDCLDIKDVIDHFPSSEATEQRIKIILYHDGINQILSQNFQDIYLKVPSPFISTKYDEIVIGFRAMREYLKKEAIEISASLLQ